ncbi:MAG: urea ABC transporter ATP-binding subunit UrtE [Chloroflexi bacterium]|nr:urea ABC transporter ATP-binding subunit UrtE [Chloroflexota bacterium]MDA1269967.1 urea ABC transporter ATP-binding subunit UrtE [Chloroflexota bacterium]
MLSISGLSAGYGQSTILKEVNIDLLSGQAICLIGRNGVGKTTLLKTIMGHIRPNLGKIVLEDNDVTTWAANRRAVAGIGYVPQGREIFPFLTVHENLLMGLEALPKRQRSIDALDGMYDKFPALKTFRTKAAGTLSGGQQQQLALARVLVRKPKVLLLDEPTEGLQPNIVQEIEDLLHGIRDSHETSILLVEQFLDFAMSVADHCYVMENGEIVLEGQSKDLDRTLVREYLAV